MSKPTIYTEEVFIDRRETEGLKDISEIVNHYRDMMISKMASSVLKHHGNLTIEKGADTTQPSAPCGHWLTLKFTKISELERQVKWLEEDARFKDEKIEYLTKCLTKIKAVFGMKLLKTLD